MIYCVWYPSGGFGHFVNAILSIHGENFVRPSNQLEFSNTGDSHSLALSAPKYLHNQPYTYNFLPNVNYSVLVDNGICNEGVEFRMTFPQAKIIKMCYDNYSWPVVAKTMIEKVTGTKIETQLDLADWPTSEPWARREKYFLYLRDHNLRFFWRSDVAFINIDVDKLTNYSAFKLALENSGVQLSNFKTLWDEWFKHNFQYFAPVHTAQHVIKQIRNNQSVDLSMITDEWHRAVIYYYIWLEFGVEVPHNNHADWFQNTDEIITMLSNLGIFPYE